MKEAPKPEVLFLWGTQARKLYEALVTEGEVTSVRIQRGLRINYYADTLDDIRAAIRPHGFDIARRHLRGGLWAYRLAVVHEQAA
jgi:hypothetical protein